MGQPVHTLPGPRCGPSGCDAARRAATCRSTWRAERIQAAMVAGHSMVVEPPLHHGPQPRPSSASGRCMQRRSCCLISCSLARSRLAIDCALDRKRPFPGLPAEMREAQEVERLRLPLAPPSRRSAAKRPNSIRRVFSGCSSRPNFSQRAREALAGSVRRRRDAGSP